MGAYLDKPVEDKNPESGSSKDNAIWWGACSMQGWRCGMEDAHIADEITASGEVCMLFGVFDGHGGKEVALLAKERFRETLVNLEDYKNKNYQEALRLAFMNFDAEVKDKEYANDTGTTSCVVLLTPTKIICANAGDSRGTLLTGTKTVGLSEDHKPDNPDELSRIEKASHYVEDSRVDGNLALSRAFGDYQYKNQAGISAEQQAVTANPDITTRDRNADDKFIMLACDGIWDCLSNEQCTKRVSELITKHKVSTPGKKCSVTSKPVEEMFGEILAPNTEDGIGTDNMTAILIFFTAKK